ncbi:MAG: Uma2 family endonuclease, partial [Cyanobacteria bacterium P01_G01_bin.49]
VSSVLGVRRSELGFFQRENQDLRLLKKVEWSINYFCRTHVNRPTYGTVEQLFILPGSYDWERFKIIQSILEEQATVKISYLDEQIELMTTGEDLERIKTILGFLIELYLCEKEIDYIPVGSATRKAKIKGVSFQPDESYYLDKTREHPDLAVEIIFISGGIDKLEKYKRFQVTEVWFWKNNQLSIYYLHNEEYEPVKQSVLLPDLDIDLLVRCVNFPSRPQAKKMFMEGLQ